MKYARVKTPTILQIESVECGAACLAIVLAHHGRYETLETLRAACGVSRDGSKASNICKAARQFGFFARGYKKEPEGLLDIEPPMVIFWEFNHFVVVEGFGEGKVYLNDPAHGPRTVTDEEFNRSFTGIVLTFEKTSAFVPGGTPPSVWPALWRRLRGSSSGLLYAVLSTLLLVLPGLVNPVLSRVFVDACLVSRMQSWTGPLLAAMVLCGLMTAAASWLQQGSLSRVETRLSLAGSSQFFWHILRLPTSFFAQRSAGEIGHRVDINQRLASLLGGQLAANAVNALLVLLYVALMIRYDAALTALAVLIAALNIAALKFSARVRSDHSQRMVQEQGRMMGVAVDGLRNIESMKACGEEGAFFSRWAGFHAKVANSEQSLGAITQYLAVMPPLLGALNVAAILSFGGLRVMDGAMTMGMLAALQALTTGFLNPVNRLVALGGRMQEIRGDLDRVEDALCNPVVPGLNSTADDALALERPRGQVELRGVTFGYSRLEPPLIRDFNLTVAAGTRVALVGGSGSGKSTVAKLVSGITEPWEGEVLFDGVPRARWPRRALCDSVAMVDQDIMLFEGTVRDNIALWDTTLEESRVIRASKDAVLHDDIAARPGGYNHKVEEGGWNFSGGQRQRVEIARALAIDPRVLILDEATSALDPRTERILEDNLRRRGCTCLIVAHRLSTVRGCDEIVVLEQGVAIERGTHDELVRKGGAYARLIQSH